MITYLFVYLFFSKEDNCKHLLSLWKTKQQSRFFWLYKSNQCLNHKQFLFVHFLSCQFEIMSFFWDKGIEMKTCLLNYLIHRIIDRLIDFYSNCSLHLNISFPPWWEHGIYPNKSWIDVCFKRGCQGAENICKFYDRSLQSYQYAGVRVYRVFIYRIRSGNLYTPTVFSVYVCVRINTVKTSFICKMK